MTSPRPNPDWPATPRRVVVTGMGMLTALGNDVTSTWEGMVAGRSGIARIASFDPSRLQAQIAGEVKDFDASGVLDKKEMRRTDRYIQFGLVAARQAMDQAGLPARMEGSEAERTGVIMGTGLGGVGTLVEGISINATRGPDRISPFLIPMGIPNVGAGQVAISFGMTGPNFTTVSACATGGHAIGEAWETQTARPSVGRRDERDNGCTADALDDHRCARRSARADSDADTDRERRRAERR
jgi:3-oxoacyl-[acyl-carrier-protein] synthase II